MGIRVLGLGFIGFRRYLKDPLTMGIMVYIPYIMGNAGFISSAVGVRVEAEEPNLGASKPRLRSKGKYRWGVFSGFFRASRRRL